MATFTKAVLSGSVDGAPIAVTATASPGTTIHTGSSTPADIHEVWLYAAGYSSSAATLTIQWGGTSAFNQFVVAPDYGSGLMLVVPGLIIKGNETPLVIRAFASVSNVINVFGYVHTIV